MIANGEKEGESVRETDRQNVTLVALLRSRVPNARLCFYLPVYESSKIAD